MPAHYLCVTNRAGRNTPQVGFKDGCEEPAEPNGHTGLPQPFASDNIPPQPVRIHPVSRPGT